MCILIHLLSLTIFFSFLLLFSPSRSFVYYAWKLVSTLSILGAAVFVTVTSTSFAQTMGGALLVSLFWQQCGWLAHDFGHHQVFKNRTLNDYGVLFVGNFLQAFSLEWWKNKHNTHHAIPNLHESATDAHDGDPDIDTLPFLAWSQKFIEKCKEGGSAASPAARFCVRNQAVLYFPILFFARITWALSSLAYAFQAKVSLFGSTEEKSVALSSSNGSLRYPLLEKLLLIAHYSWYLTLAFLPNSIPTALCFIFVSQTFAGLLLAIAFGVGHNGMSIYDSDKRPGFCELQVTTTRNVDDTFFVGWFMGGLHYQIEHHLFPFVPRHSLHKVRPLVEALCKKHGVRYHSTGLLEGSVEILSYLDTVSKGLQSFPAM